MALTSAEPTTTPSAPVGDARGLLGGLDAETDHDGKIASPS